jgi:hypothetical protein
VVGINIKESNDWTKERKEPKNKEVVVGINSKESND